MEADDTVGNYFRGKSQIGFAEIFGNLLIRRTPVINKFSEIFDLVPAEGGITFPCQPISGFPSQDHFNTRPVAFWNIGKNGCSHIVDLTGKHQLILIIHVI